MRTVFCLAGAAILLVTLAAHAAAQACPDVTGCWQGDFAGNYSGTLGISFQQTGDQLSGVVTANVAVPALGEAVGSLSGSAACAFIDFAATISVSIASVQVAYSAQVTGDCMAGTFSVNGVPGNTWQACRVSCCGNGVIQLSETCDDGNTVSGDGCSDTCMVEAGFSCVGQPSVCTPLVCGNGVVQPGEACDDGNTASGDGCSDTCTVEAGFTCSGQPSVCIPIVCGNGVVQPGEQCDDGNNVNGDCCTADCRLDPAGTACTLSGSLPGVCDPNGHCVGMVGIPTLSQWGVLALSLVMFVAVLRRRSGIAARRR